MEAKMKEFTDTIGQCSRMAVDIAQKKQLAKKTAALEAELVPVLEELHSVYCKKANLPPSASFLDLADRLREEAQTAQKAAEQAREEKEKLKLEKSMLSDLLSRTKRDIEQMVEDNHKMEAQLSDTSSLPTVLRLLKSHSNQ